MPENGTIGTAYISTGGGSPGSSVRGQYGYRDALLKNNRREEKEEVEELNPRILDRSWVVKNDNVNQQHGQTTTTSSLAPTSAVINNDPVSHSIVSTCVFQCAAGGAGLISTASWVPTIARRDEEGTRHRRRRKETGVETVEYGNITRPASTLLRNIQGKDHCGQDKHWRCQQQADEPYRKRMRQNKEEEEEEHRSISRMRQNESISRMRQNEEEEETDKETDEETVEETEDEEEELNHPTFYELRGQRNKVIVRE